MKKRNLLVAITLGVAVFFTACDDDDTTIAKPEITITELGEGDSHGNDHTGVAGSDLHVEAEIVAEGKIDLVQVVIHHEGEHKSALETEWEVDTTYTKYSGLKNTTFHEHIDIDEWAEVGEYHFHFIVTDMEGNQSTAESELEIIEE